MKLFKTTSIGILSLITFSVIYSFTSKMENIHLRQPTPGQNMNLFVSHGHCSSPFAGKVENFNLQLTPRYDQGNPMEGAKLNFDINPASFRVCADKEFVNKLQTPGLFWTDHSKKMTFRSTDIYTMGVDWYQINGILSIKGIEKNMKFFVTGIREPQQQMATQLIFEGQVNLEDWGIDYDKLVNGESNSHPTKWMHLNMIVEM